MIQPELFSYRLSGSFGTVRLCPVVVGMDGGHGRGRVGSYSSDNHLQVVKTVSGEVLLIENEPELTVCPSVLVLATHTTWSGCKF